jgi:putative ABC transport system permease protein
VAVTSGLASQFGLKVGGTWRVGGRARQVVGIVENPLSLLDEFALVLPGQVTTPTQTTVLFDAPGVNPSSIGSNVSTPASVAANSVFNPQTISLTAATLGMLLIALVGVGGFTVLAQRRLRSIGMLGAQGATDGHIRLVVRANGAVTGMAGAVIGFVVGLLAWLAYRPSVETSSHHVIGVFQLPWLVIIVAMILAVLAAYFAAARPARTIARVPIVAALSGRPPAPRKVRRWSLPTGVVFAVVAFILLGVAGSSAGSSGNSNSPLVAVVFGFLALTVAVVLLSPALLGLLVAAARAAPGRTGTGREAGLGTWLARVRRCKLRHAASPPPSVPATSSRWRRRAPPCSALPAGATGTAASTWPRPSCSGRSVSRHRKSAWTPTS